MIKFLAFSLYACLGVALMVIWPVMAHPTLPIARKLLWSALALLILVPGALALYVWVGVPALAQH